MKFFDFFSGEEMMNYLQCGVDIEGSNAVIRKIKQLASITYNPNVRLGVDLFGAVYNLKKYRRPILVSSVDGVGTKLMIAKELGKLEVCGRDLVNHCINDILCQGAKPLFFMDYIAQDCLRNEEIIQLVRGMVSACQEAGIALIGGETAQMPGIYVSGQLDVVGFIVGVVEEGKLIDGSAIKPGDVILGLPSTGLHTNGYSLARKILSSKFGWSPYYLLFWIEDLQERLGTALLKEHKSYLKPITSLLEAGIKIHGLAHITGGGIVGNILRILPPNCTAFIRWRSWPVLPIFQFLQREGRIPTSEMYRVFNMGIGMILVTPQNQIDGIFELFTSQKEPVYVIGEIKAGTKRVKFYTKEEENDYSWRY